MPLASQTAPSGSGNPFCPPGVLRSGRWYDPGARAVGVTPWPRQIAATRSRSRSNPAQWLRPTLSTSARGVRLSAGSPGPAPRASRTDEKNGKSGSTQSAQPGVGWGCSGARAGVLVTERRAISSVTMTSVRVLVDLVTPGSLWGSQVANGGPAIHARRGADGAHDRVGDEIRGQRSEQVTPRSGRCSFAVETAKS